MADAKKTYQYHKPSDDGLAKTAKLRKAFSDLDDLIRANSPTGREQAVAITNLEQAAMWAIKAVVVNDPKSEVTP
jgi:hypothetical protein